MRFSTNHHRLYWGIDLHARTLYVCIVRHDGERLWHRPMPAAPAPFLQAVPPYREGLVVAVACMCTWYGRADLCAAQAIPCVLGPALAMNALQGGTANTDTSDAHKLAALLRGGRLPQASVSPADRRSTRDLGRRRTHLRRQRAARLAPVHTTNAPYHWPDLGTPIADQAHREGVAERFNDPTVHTTLAGDLALLPYDDAWLRALERARVPTATPHAAQTLSGLPTVPGMGTILRRVLLDALPDIGRCPRVQDCASYARLVQCRKASAGTRVGTSGKQIGKAHRTWACATAAPWCLRNTPNGQTLRTR